MVDYSDLTAALTRARERAAATVNDDTYLSELLELSAGTNPAGTKQYRPYLCAARWIEQNRRDQSFSEADGAKFTGQAKPIASLLALQASIDRALQLTVPDGFTAVVPTAFRLQGTRSHKTQIRP